MKKNIKKVNKVYKSPKIKKVKLALKIWGGGGSCTSDY
jgi:hypothetical protein